MSKTEYVSCEVTGRGHLNRDVSFKIIDLSAEKIRISTDAPLMTGADANLVIFLDSGVVEIEVKVKGKVSKKIDSGYEIDFTDMTDETREEIDGLMKSSCS